MASYPFLKAWRARARDWQQRVPPPPRPITRDALGGALAGGQPLVSVVQPAVPLDLFAEVLADLIRLLEGAGSSVAGEVTGLSRAVAAAGPAELASLAEAGLAADDDGLARWAANHGLRPDVVATVAGLALQPFLTRLAAGLADAVSFGGWRRNYCPVCGRRPDVARVDPDNIRFLHCGQCDAQWPHHRTACVWCETDDAKRMRIVTAAELEPWRADVCDACGGYVKTLDQRHGGVLAPATVDLFLEDARTLSLDLIAREQGYRRGGSPQ